MEKPVNSLNATVTWYDPLASIDLGNQPNQRTSNHIMIRGFKLRLVVHNNSATGNIFRFAILRTDLDSNFSGSTAIMRNGENEGQQAIQGDLRAVMYPFDLDVVKPILDKTIVLDGVNQGHGPNYVVRDYYVPCREHVKYYSINDESGAQKAPRFHVAGWIAEADNDIDTNLIGDDVPTVCEYSFALTTYFTDIYGK